MLCLGRNHGGLDWGSGTKVDSRADMFRGTSEAEDTIIITITANTELLSYAKHQSNHLTCNGFSTQNNPQKQAHIEGYIPSKCWRQDSHSGSLAPESMLSTPHSTAS